MKFKDYYEALGVERTATHADIKKAYRKLAHKYHPDVSADPNSEAKFKDIAEAYATLKNPEKREAYDNLGKHPAGESFTPSPDWQQHFHAGEAGLDDVDLADLFSAFGRTAGGSRRRQSFPVPGQDYEIVAPVSLEQIYRGEEIELSAELPEYDANGLAHRVARTFRITIPKAAANGQRLRLAGKGGPGFNGGRPGDLYVRICSIGPMAATSISICRSRPGKPCWVRACTYPLLRERWSSPSNRALLQGKNCGSPNADLRRPTAAPGRSTPWSGLKCRKQSALMNTSC